ncbi:helix-turn-helix domain-containing protein [Synechococcales cyanobacterium C]|uniref:Helix-turn-helix domain-containing protein n=1 Tax=Petrachloros mirabilis ULC683 TaxID=2781853 RepID=A0A8K1ZXL9_9CYAN|nr:Crp/Fnr family transcriptional regulator [Petrachloros mirabilis]NCJ06768.1 helix-turn-helix domain-containing protein [Petrachloros mirabilis ULC683]
MSILIHNRRDPQPQRSFVSSRLRGDVLQNPSLPPRRNQTFRKRELIPLPQDILWRLEAGTVRTFTLAEDGALITLGLWGVGDVVGSALAQIRPHQAECLSTVNVSPLVTVHSAYLNQILLAHLHQSQELLSIRSGPMQQRLLQLLDWLALKFGRSTDQGIHLNIRLTHQEIADILGTTRVTVTRLLSHLESEKYLSWICGRILLPIPQQRLSITGQQ